MIIGDRKKAVTIILSRFGGKPEQEKMVEAKPEYEGELGDQDFQAIAEDILIALNDKSASDLARALRAFVDQVNIASHSEKNEQD